MTKNNVEKYFKRFHEVDFGPKSEDEKQTNYKTTKNRSFTGRAILFN